MRSLTKIFPINKQQRCLNIGMKISLYYLGLLIFSIAVCSFLYYKIYSSITAHKVSDISYQMLGSISANVNALVDHVNIYSKMIISDTGVRECLKKPQSSSNLLAQRSLNRYLINMVETMPLISAIYLFDNYGNRYGADKLTVKKHRIADLTKAEWYTAVCNAKGGYLLRLNAGDIFKENAPHENYVSFIRIINDLDTQNPIGTLIINISNQALQNSFSGVDQKYFTGLVLKDDRNR
ncbi:MAG TPA: cache domain-containing protein, partial [Bacillota bacterium]|nr:cache domain-containing protein [Bacillota bacterium]